MVNETKGNVKKNVSVYDTTLYKIKRTSKIIELTSRRLMIRKK